MSVFKDEAYENLDWISQAVEPYEFPLNDYLAELPDEVELTIEQIMNLGGSFDKDNVARVLLLKDSISYEEAGLIRGCYKVEHSHQINVDLVDNTLDGFIKIVKAANQISDEKIAATMQGMIYDYIGNHGNKKTILELTQLLMPEHYEAIQEMGKSSRMIREFATKVKEQLQNKVWNVKSYTLWSDVLLAMRNYLADDNQAALGKLGLFSILVKNGAPLYSMKG